MIRWILIFAVVGLYVLHQDTWFWNTAKPLVFGFLPVGLFYHATYSVAIVVLMMLLVRYAWPSHIEDQFEHNSTSRKQQSVSGRSR